MARNEEIDVYGIPQIYKNRYFHPYTVRRKTTGNIGQIIPIYNNLLVQPGDTISLNLRSFFRLTTSLFPSMDNLTADIFCFAQDWQNNWEHTKEFWGEDQATPFEELTEYTIPQIVLQPSSAVETDDIMHHLALPAMKANEGAIPDVARVNNVEVERLSYNTYIDIYNHYFRDQNYINRITFSKGDEDIDYEALPVKKLLTAARFHDYFAGTPEAQKGEPEFLPLGTEAPVIGNGTAISLTGFNNTTPGAYQDHVLAFGSTNNDEYQRVTLGLEARAAGTVPEAGAQLTGREALYNDVVAMGLSKYAATSGMIVDLTNTIGATLNALRLITATQHIKEELMWYGSMFEDIIMSQWGVSMNATSFRIPEYLGGKRININMDTVLQTSSTDAESPQGNAAGYSVTFDEDFMFTKSFTTWQNIMIVCVIRQDHTYAQGVANQHLKKRKYDFYWDEFQGLGAQPRKVAEIALTGTSADDNTWNFAPAWREYTSEVDRATGLMSPQVDNTLANYTYTDNYTSVPNSGQDWIDETPLYVDRTLVVPSTTTDQFMMDFVFEIKKTSIIPNYKLPGLDKL